MTPGPVDAAEGGLWDRESVTAADVVLAASWHGRRGDVGFAGLSPRSVPCIVCAPSRVRKVPESSCGGDG